MACLAGRSPPLLQARSSRRCAFQSPERPARAARPGAIAQQQESSGADRRQALLGLTATLIAARSQRALANDEAVGVSTYYGLATPPTSYGGYGGNDPNASPKYKFEYPTGWKSDVINKTDKGTQGIDCRLYNPKNKLQQVFVITFGRAGEDNKSFKLTDIDSTIAGFAGADYDMQDALSMGEKKTSQREVNGQLFFDIEIESPDAQYLSTVTVMQGKVYACFVKSPARLFPAAESQLRNIISTFRTIEEDTMTAGP